MEFEQVLQGRRSIRKYNSDVVSHELIEKIIQAAIYAPSWKNAQTTRYYVADGEAKNELAQCLPEFNQKNVENAPVIIVSTTVTKRSGYNRQGEPDSHLGSGFQYFDNGLQIENLCLAAYNLGLGTLIMGLYDNEGIRAFFDIPENEEVVAVIALGYADIEVEMPKRKKVEEVIKYKC